MFSIQLSTVAMNKKLDARRTVDVTKIFLLCCFTLKVALIFSTSDFNKKNFEKHLHNVMYDPAVRAARKTSEPGFVSDRIYL